MIQKVYNLFWSKDKDFVRNLRNTVGFTPKNLVLFKQAFLHRSNPEISNEKSNERLEYLGDALLSMVTAEFLFQKYLYKDEGFLTKMRAKIVRRSSLNSIGKDMGLDVFLKQYNQVHLSESMYGNALEALVGAIYIEKGYDFTRDFVICRIFQEYLDFDVLEKKDENFKSRLLEWCQKHGKDLEYDLLKKFRTQKRDRFRVAVVIDGKKISEASDFNKKGAEQIASRRAMQSLGIIARKSP